VAGGDNSVQRAYRGTGSRLEGGHRLANGHNG
jgi:hypothetical protein